MLQKYRPNTLDNAPLQYAPSNELGVIYLFAHIAKRKQFRIEEIKPDYPDCIAYRRAGNCEKLVRIEFEFKSSNFKTHKHNPKKCDCIVCWHHDWPDCPKRIEVIELKKDFGVAPNIWIQPSRKNQWHWLDEYNQLNWGLSKRATTGDLLLMYRCFPLKNISDIFIVTGEKSIGKADWRDGECYAAPIKKLCKLNSPIFLNDLKNHSILKTSSFVKRNMQGNLLISEYWPYIYEIIVNRNPNIKKSLSKYKPEKL